MKILENVRKVPGGLMIVPMILAAFINTFCPQIVQIGNPTTAIFSASGTMTVVGIIVLFSGISISPRQFLSCLKKGGALLLVKFLIDLALIIWAVKIFGQAGFLGISTLALAACLISVNPGVYIGIMEGRGTNEDKATYALLNIFVLPFVPICILGFSNGYGIDWMAILATCVPMAVGMIFAILDPSIRQFTASGTAIMLPFLGFCLGSNVDLILAAKSGLSGVLLYLIYMAVNAVPLILLERIGYKEKGFVSAAICCVGGLSMSVPSLMAELDPSYLPYVDTATAQLAMAVAISAVITPILVKIFSGELKK